MITFKLFLEQEDMRHEHEHFINHIADEELGGCKLQSTEIDKKTVNIVADCNDRPRRQGYQADLSKKLHERLKKHAHLSHYKPRVHHKRIDDKKFPVEPTEHEYQDHLKDEG